MSARGLSLMPSFFNSFARPSGKLSGTMARRIFFSRKIRRMTWAQAGLLTPSRRELSLIGAQGRDAAVRRLGAGAVNFQIAHHEQRAAAGVEVDERVGHEQADGVKHVRVALAVRDDEQGFGRFIANVPAAILLPPRISRISHG